MNLNTYYGTSKSINSHLIYELKNKNNQAKGFTKEYSTLSDLN